MHGAGILEEEATRSPVFSDSDLADRFAERHKQHLRYVSAWGQWMRYDGKRWHTEETLLAFDLIRKQCREISAVCNRTSEAKSLASAGTIAAVERIAKADRRLAATIDQWDSDPWLLNTPDGVIDLRTGKLLPHKAEDYLTKITAVGPEGDCPEWKAHLMKIMGDDRGLVDYLQRALGYSLTGSVQEHALFFAFGTGANGKGTTFETIARLLGDYARTAPMEVFTWSPNDRHPTELAMLRGARFVTASETEEGRGWAESRIKSLTGGDRITARFMRQDFFEFLPQFKLWLQGNHKPSLRAVDEAIRRRFNLLPFSVTIPSADRDKHLTEKLEREWPGILQWMLDGCLKWQNDGLQQPAAVKEATEEYLSSEDALGLWFEQCCVAESGAPGLFTSEMFESWKAFALKAGEQVRTLKKFSLSLESRSHEFGIKKTNGLRRRMKTVVQVEGRSVERTVERHGRGFEGVRFKSDEELMDTF